MWRMKRAVTGGCINAHGKAQGNRVMAGQRSGYSKARGQERRHASVLEPRAGDASSRLPVAKGCHCDRCHSVGWQTAGSSWPGSLSSAQAGIQGAKAVGSPKPPCLQYLLCTSMLWTLPGGRGGTAPSVFSWVGWSQHESFVARYGPRFFGNSAQLAAAWLSTSLTQLLEQGRALS